MQLKPGLKLASPASSATFIVIRAPQDDVALTLAGAAVSTDATPGAAAAAAGGDTVQVGKRYSDEAGSLELLCTAAGSGPLMLADEQLSPKAAKSLPSSD